MERRDLCLLHQLRRPAEVDRLLEKIESVQGDKATCAVRETLLAEATFGEIRKSPQTATRLAEKAFEQIELGQWPSVRSSDSGARDRWPCLAGSGAESVG